MKPNTAPGASDTESRNVLLVGRWHSVTRDQETALQQALAAVGPGKLVFIVTACDKGGTKRNPLSYSERLEVVQGLANTLGRPFEIHGVTDTKSANEDWVKHVEDVVRTDTGGATVLHPQNSILISSNHDVLARFAGAGYTCHSHLATGKTPADIIQAVRLSQDWRNFASSYCVEVWDKYDLAARIARLFENVLVNDDGELSDGRNFKVYAQGMDASMQDKIRDIVPHIKPGRIVDKGCGTGTMLVYLSQVFPESEIIGMDLSRSFLHMAESQHYASQNVSVVMGNIIEQRFAPATITTAIFSSDMHEVHSYNDYDPNCIRRALRNTRIELVHGGRLIIRDGIKPPAHSTKVWMRLDEETRGRFYRFANDFKGKSKNPGIRFSERKFSGEPWILVSLHEVNEFLSKKDYLANWDIEVNEEFGVFTLGEWRQELEASGYRVLECRSYLNPWILANRYKNCSWLFADENGRPGVSLPYPDTTAVIVGEAV